MRARRARRGIRDKEWDRSGNLDAAACWPAPFPMWNGNDCVRLISLPQLPPSDPPVAVRLASPRPPPAHPPPADGLLPPPPSHTAPLALLSLSSCTDGQCSGTANGDGARSCSETLALLRAELHGDGKDSCTTLSRPWRAATADKSKGVMPVAVTARPAATAATTGDDGRSDCAEDADGERGGRPDSGSGVHCSASLEAWDRVADGGDGAVPLRKVKEREEEKGNKASAKRV